MALKKEENNTAESFMSEVLPSKDIHVYPHMFNCQKVCLYSSYVNKVFRLLLVVPIDFYIIPRLMEKYSLQIKIKGGKKRKFIILLHTFKKILSEKFFIQGKQEDRPSDSLKRKD